MMYTMNTTGTGAAFTLFGMLHAIGALAMFIGLAFLLTLAIKTLTAQQLKMWGLGLFLGGVVACVLAAATLGFKAHDRRYKVSGMMNGGMMMNGKMTHGGGMGMMSNMGMMLEGLEGDEFDEAFIRMMIPHHEGAIDMAEQALTSAGHPEMKQLATDIIEAQQREIDMMKSWLTTWGYEN